MRPIVCLVFQPKIIIDPTMSFTSCTEFIQIFFFIIIEKMSLSSRSTVPNCRIADSAIEGELNQFTPDSDLREYFEELWSGRQLLPVEYTEFLELLAGSG